MPREIILTQEDKERLERELERLTGEGRSEISERLRQARETSRELVENTEYLEAKEEQARLEARISDIEARLAEARVVERPAPGGAVDVGAHVRVRDPDSRTTAEYDIVGSGEGDPVAGRISRDSPIASGLLGHHEGDVVEIETPAGERRRLKILSVG